MCTRLKKENGLPVFLCVVHPNIEANKKYPFSVELIDKGIGTLTSENQELFAGYKIVPSNLLEDSILKIANKYDLNGGNIEIFKTPKWSDNNKIRDYIKNNDFQNFKSKVPKCIAVLFNEFTRELSEMESNDI